MSAEPAANSTADRAAAPRLRSHLALLRAVPILVLLVAIAAQATLMTTVNADRQAGSGFAMFSSVDFAGSRSVVVTATYNGDVVDVRLPISTTDQVDGLLRSPTDDSAAQLARDLGEFEWVEQDGRIRATADGTNIDGFSVTVRRLTADGHELGSEVLAHAVAP